MTQPGKAKIGGEKAKKAVEEKKVVEKVAAALPSDWKLKEGGALHNLHNASQTKLHFHNLASISFQGLQLSSVTL